MAVAFPDTGESPWTDPNGEVWTWTGEAWSRSRLPGFINVSDPVVAALVNDVDSDTRAAITARYNNTPRLSPLARSTKLLDGDVFRVAMIGMSIASGNRNLPMLGERLRTMYGVGASRPMSAGVLGGSYTAAVSGWEKQNFGGPGVTRLRGKAASTGNTLLPMYGDTVTLWFSREADSEACNIVIDGEVVGTTPAAGSQAYMQKQTFAVTLGAHEVEIVKPAGAGYCYLELYEAYDSTHPGVIYHNWTQGGTTLCDMVTLRVATSPQVAGVAITTNAGIDAHFDNDDFDLYVIGHDVNDAGLGASNFTSVFTPTLARIVQLTRDRAVPLVLISSMAGHYAFEEYDAEDFATYNNIRTLYRSTAAAESHVTHIDWHGATALTDIEKYAATYYPTVTAIDQAAGTFTGDFIHASADQAHMAFEAVTSAAFNLPPAFGRTNGEEMNARNVLAPVNPGAPPIRRVWELVSLTSTLNGSTDTFTTPAAHGLAVGDKVVFKEAVGGTVPEFTGAPGWILSVPTSTTFTMSYTDGGAQFVTASGGASYSMGFIFKESERDYFGAAEAGYIPRWANGAVSYRREGFDVVPVYADRDLTTPDEVGGHYNGRAQIAAAGTSGEWGAYKEYADATIVNFTIRKGLHAFGDTAYFLIRYSGELQVRVGVGANIWFADEDGNAMEGPYASTHEYISYPSVDIAGQPAIAVVPVQGNTSSPIFITMDPGTSGVRLYDFAIMPSPVWPGRYV